MLPSNEIEKLYYLGVKNQLLLTKYINYGMVLEAKQLQKIDHKLIDLLINYKMTGNSTSYIWRTQDDGKVRDSHAANDDQIFLWNNRPATGHPGEDFNCRCWAEPIGDSFYANQLLITKINDNPNKWGNRDFIEHYRTENNGDVTLSETGYLSDVIEHYSNNLGIYDRVNNQIIDEARVVREDSFIYSFGRPYEFGEVLLAIGGAMVNGIFVGDARVEDKFLVINGIITYEFKDKFSDPFQLIEITDGIPGINRQEAEEIVGDFVDFAGYSYNITDTWQTKFNATVSLEQ